MGDTRHRTTIEIGVDDSEIKRLGQQLERALDPALVSSFERMMERSTRQVDALVKVTERLGRVTQQMARTQEAAAKRAEKANKGGGGFFSSMFGSAAGSYMGTRAGSGGGGGFGSAYGRANQAGGMAGRFAPVSEGFFGGALGGLPLVGPFLGATISGAQSYYNAYAGYMNQAAGAVGQTGGPLRIRGGMQLGVGLPEQIQMMSQFSGSSGRTGEGLSEVAPGLLGLQRILGLQNAGGVLGALESTGGTAGMSDVTDMIAAGMEAGVRNSRLDQYLQQVSSFAEQARSQGILLEPATMSSLGRMFSGMGGEHAMAFRGRAGTSAALNMAQGLRRAGQGTDAFSYMALRAAGFTGRPGGRSFMQAQLALEETPHEVLPQLFQSLLSGGGDPEAVADMIQRGFRGMGVELSTRQVLALAGNQGQIGTSGGGVGRRMLHREMGTRSRSMAGVFRPAATAARLEAGRIGIGGQVERGVVTLQQFEQDMVQRFLPGAMRMVEGISGYAQEIVDAYDAGGGEAVMTRLTEILAGGVASALGFDPEDTAALRERVEELMTGTIPDEVGSRPFTGGTPLPPFLQEGVDQGYQNNAGGNMLRAVDQAVQQFLHDYLGNPHDPSADPQASLMLLRRGGEMVARGAAGLERTMGTGESDVEIG